jgi:dTDP-4-dehydrorhamnose reductase
VPTPVGSLARTIRALASGEHFGTWHVCGRGKVSRYEWARAVLEGMGEDPDNVVGTVMRASPMPSARPVDTGMDTLGLRTAGLAEPGDWRHALRAALGTDASQT